MADEHDPKRHAVFRFEHAGVTSERFLSRNECFEAAKAKVLAYPKEPAVIFMSTEILTVEAVTTQAVYPWYPPAPAEPPVPGGEPVGFAVDENGLEIV